MRTRWRRVALALRGAVPARPDIEARRGEAALRTEGEPALPTGVPMTELDDGTWRRPATGDDGTGKEPGSGRGAYTSRKAAATRA
jgi:hypothetical protein